MNFKHEFKHEFLDLFTACHAAMQSQDDTHARDL